MQKLSREFYNRDTVVVAQELLGKYLVCVTDEIERVGRIVEVEAYLGPHDLAAHSAKGITPRTEIMFGPAGYAYVYLIYGIYHCFNVVTDNEGSGSAVLIRAIEPIKNINGRTQGPGLLCQSMRIDRRFNGQDLLSNNLYIAQEISSDTIPIVKTARVGVSYAKHWAKRLLRFYIKGNSYVSQQ